MGKKQPLERMLRAMRGVLVLLLCLTLSVVVLTACDDDDDFPSRPTSSSLVGSCP